MGKLCVAAAGRGRVMRVLPDRLSTRLALTAGRLNYQMDLRIGNVLSRSALASFGLARRLYPIRRKFLRKEVIQPQVPLRLPCYDLVPITEVTFDACVSCEFARRLRVPPAFVA